MKKIIQIVTGDENNETLYALTEDGKVYHWYYSATYGENPTKVSEWREMKSYPHNPSDKNEK